MNVPCRALEECWLVPRVAQAGCSCGLNLLNLEKLEPRRVSPLDRRSWPLRIRRDTGLHAPQQDDGQNGNADRNDGAHDGYHIERLREGKARGVEQRDAERFGKLF